MPIGFVRFCFGFFPNPVHPVCPASTFCLCFSFSPCPLGFEGPTTFLNLDLIYSTNVWEKRELDFFVCLFVCLRCLANDYYICKFCPTLTLFQVSPKKGPTVRLPVGSRRAELAYRAPGAVMWRGGHWNSCLISVVLIKWELWVLKNSVSKWNGVDDFILVGLGLVALKKSLLSRMYIFVGFFCLFVYFFRILHSNMRDHGVKEIQRPLSSNYTVCEFV